MGCQIERLFHTALLFVWYIGSSLGDRKDDNSCRVSPFLDKRSHAAFLGKGKQFVNGVCEEEMELIPRHLCIRSRSDKQESWDHSDILTSPELSPSNKGDKYKNKPTPNTPSKKPTRKITGNKKLKGGKRQRKKNKKKKMGKKKKKS